MNPDRVALIDADSRRRAAICHNLSQTSLHVEPFENIGELPRTWCSSRPILLHDEPQAITMLYQVMDEMNLWSPVIAYSEAISARRVVRAIKAGAMDYISWPLGASALVDVIQRVSEEADQICDRRALEREARRRVGKLTSRERQVLRCMVDGMSNRCTGTQLKISWRTVEAHRINLVRKLGASNTADAIKIAVRAGLDADYKGGTATLKSPS